MSDRKLTQEEFTQIVLDALAEINKACDQIDEADAEAKEAKAKKNQADDEFIKADNEYSEAREKLEVAYAQFHGAGKGCSEAHYQACVAEKDRAGVKWQSTHSEAGKAYWNAKEAEEKLLSAKAKAKEVRNQYTKIVQTAANRIKEQS